MGVFMIDRRVEQVSRDWTETRFEIRGEENVNELRLLSFGQTVEEAGQGEIMHGVLPVSYSISLLYIFSSRLI